MKETETTQRPKFPSDVCSCGHPRSEHFHDDSECGVVLYDPDGFDDECPCWSFEDQS